MKLDKKIQEILDDIFRPVRISQPVYCRLCDRIMDKSERLAHLHTFHTEYGRDWRNSEVDETYPDRIVKLHDEAYSRIRKIESEKQKSLDAYGVVKNE
jgi:hypothetical protein